MTTFTDWRTELFSEHEIDDPDLQSILQQEMHYILNHINERPSNALRTAIRAYKNKCPLASPVAKALLSKYEGQA